MFPFYLKELSSEGITFDSLMIAHFLTFARRSFAQIPSFAFFFRFQHGLREKEGFVKPTTSLPC